MEPREYQLHFGLHAYGTLYPATRTRGLSGQVVQQHGLAHARVTAHYQRPALTGADRVHEPVQRAALGTPVRHGSRTALPSGMCTHRPGFTPHPEPHG